jgi:hypothetical protein
MSDRIAANTAEGFDGLRKRELLARKPGDEAATPDFSP